LSQQAQHGFDLDQTFLTARQQQAEGCLDEAKRLYGKIMGRVPHHAESLVMLASVAYQQGDEVQAEAYLDRAIGIYQAVLKQMPDLLRVHAPLVNVLLARRRPSEAESHAETLQLPINPIRAEPAEFERRRRDGIARKLPAMLINTVPKSASESIWNKLAEGLGLAQGHLSLGLFPDCCLLPHRARAAAQGGLIAKEHISATPFNLKPPARSAPGHPVLGPFRARRRQHAPDGPDLAQDRPAVRPRREGSCGPDRLVDRELPAAIDRVHPRLARGSAGRRTAGQGAFPQLRGVPRRARGLLP
jgi:hypothetical protein